MNVGKGAEEILPRLFRSQAYRELGSARLFEAGLPLAPDDVSREHLRGHADEEREHYTAVMAVWSGFRGEAVAVLQAQVEAHLTAHPLPAARTWLDLAMARFLFDRAGYWQLREYDACTYAPYRDLARKIVTEEADHMKVGERAVDEVIAAGGDRATAQTTFDKWLAIALLSFGRPGSAASRQAIALGLKQRDPAVVRRDFLEDIRLGAERAGLSLPDPAL